MECGRCGRRAAHRCGGCGDRYYCSTECQQKDWLTGHFSKCTLDVGVKPGEKRPRDDPPDEETGGAGAGTGAGRPVRRKETSRAIHQQHPDDNARAKELLQYIDRLRTEHHQSLRREQQACQERLAAERVKHAREMDVQAEQSRRELHKKLNDLSREIMVQLDREEAEKDEMKKLYKRRLASMDAEFKDRLAKEQTVIYNKMRLANVPRAAEAWKEYTLMDLGQKLATPLRHIQRALAKRVVSGLGAHYSECLKLAEEAHIKATAAKVRVEAAYYEFNKTPNRPLAIVNLKESSQEAGRLFASEMYYGLVCLFHVIPKQCPKALPDWGEFKWADFIQSREKLLADALHFTGVLKGMGAPHRGGGGGGGAGAGAGAGAGRV